MLHAPIAESNRHNAPAGKPPALQAERQWDGLPGLLPGIPSLLPSLGNQALLRQANTGSGQPTPLTPLRPSQGMGLQRKCACGGSTGPTGECAECKSKREGAVQRRTTGATNPGVAPPIVHDVLNSSGKPLDAGTRDYMEPRFGQDFSDVRVHTDSKAAESARAVNALAYTVGRNIVFGAGQYSPQSGGGKELLAHELTHTIQQGGSSPSGPLRIGDTDSPDERQADEMGRNLTGAASITHPGRSLQRQLQRAPGDAQVTAQQSEPPTGAAAHDDGIGPAEVHKWMAQKHGENWEQLFQPSAANAPGEKEAQTVARMVAGGGNAPAIERIGDAPPIQKIAPVIVLGAVVLAALLCAYPFFSYAMDHYQSKGDKWMHCWVSCKITTYCGTPIVGDIVAIFDGAAKECGDYICDKLGGPCGAEWADFVADMNGVACGFQLGTPCVDCCDKQHGKKK